MPENKNTQSMLFRQRIYHILLLLIYIIISFSSCSEVTKYDYPLVDKKPMSFNYHGLEIIDEYINLENLEDSTVIRWLKKQDSLAKNVLQAISHGRDRLIDLQKQLDQKSEFKISRKIRRENGKYFFLKQSLEENYSKLYFRSNFNSNKDSLIFDPATYKNNSKYKINYIRPDWDGNQVVVSLAKPDEEISELILINLLTKEKIYGITSNAAPASLEGIDWLPDNSGFIYQHAPNFKSSDPSYFHNTIATLYIIADAVNKKLFSRITHPQLNLKPEDFPIVSYYDRTDPYLFGMIAGPSPYADTYSADIKELNNSKVKWKLLFTKQEKIKKYLHRKDSLIFLTAKESSNFKICKTSINDPNFSNPIIIIPEKKDQVITDFEYTKNGLFYTTLKNGVVARLFHFLDGKETEIELPQVSGRIVISSSGLNSKYLNVITTGWTNPIKKYLYDFNKDKFISDALVINTTTDSFESIKIKEIEIESHDGKMVPLSIIHNTDIEMNGLNSTLIRGYGSYGLSMKPAFRSSTITWLKEGGILVYAHVRGGSEKGNDWYEGGFKTTKSNTWKDVIACTEYLIEKGYTSPNKIAILGSSAGGIMMGRAITERPDLFKVAIGDVPSMNMIRSEIATNGLNSVKEFGTVKDSIEFKALLEMDSYHQIKNNINYPAVLIASGYKDSRVPIWSSGKFIARLQEATTSNNPIIFSVDFESGHSVRDNKLKTYQKYADYYAFALWQTGHPDYQPKE
ncbi:prolyl oligopeptidase family serine peptidase [Aquimarina megaterium]|uniref:prolyl oligopeptidase family serine peptidase n=1 Tax=Aquimarina megaterium TaxID=1443666 RepID=UPI000471BBF3|nr:prolyl oligopeptidase family serine peptidase [Aquimarina megaterium]